MLALRLSCSALLVLGLAAPALAGGSTAPAPKPPSVFKQVVPQPTGKNGYEELVLAVSLLEECKPFREVSVKPNATLLDKRRVIADRTVVRVLALIRQGVSKPSFSPRAAANSQQLPPELAGMRNLSRLLRMHQYVLLADGRVQEAILDARLGLQLGRAIQTDSLLTGLVGIGASATTLTALGNHLDQLSVKDCELLYQVCLEWLNQPDTFGPILEAERKVVKTNLAGLQKQLAAAAAAEGGEANPALFLEAERSADALFAQLQAEARKAPWLRRAVDVSTAPEFTRGLLTPVVAALHRAMDSYTREMAMVRLLACHARIRSFRWQQSKLPGSLAELQLGDLQLDPFTGSPLEYTPLDRGYRLLSAGPAAPQDPKAVNGRKPVSVIPGDT